MERKPAIDRIKQQLADGVPPSLPVRITFTGLTDDQLDKIHNAVASLFDAGIKFDIGTSGNEHHWNFDFSLEGPVRVDLVDYGDGEF